MDTNKPSLLKQALGAVAGAGVALALYGVYSVAAPHVKAYVLTPQSWLPERSEEPVAINDKTMDENLSVRIVARTKEIMENHTVQKDSQYLDDGHSIRRYAIEGAVRVAQAPSSAESDSESTHAAAVAYQEPLPPIEDRWDDLNPTNTPTPPSIPEPVPYVPPVPQAPPVAANVSAATQTPPDLPSSGVGITIIAGASMGVALLRRKRR